MNEKTETVKSWCIEQLGCPYIWGATKRACTPDYRKSRMAALEKDYPQYAEKIKKNCPRLMEKATSCKGCKWAKDGVGRLAYDCAQLTRFALYTVGIALVSGANSQWQKTAYAIKGEIKDMPKNLLCLVYRQDDDKRMHHTGVYMGDGWVVHAKGHDYGVVREQLDKIDKPLTHFGIPAGLYSDQELRDAGIDPSGNVPTLRRGSTGKVVKDLQLYLNAKIGAGLEPDGVFGAKTEEAVKAFQKKHGLTADGVVGPKTWAAMGVVPEQPEEPDEPTEEPDADEEPEEPAAHPPDMVSVPRMWLLSVAQTLEEIALDIREYSGGGSHAEG